MLREGFHHIRGNALMALSFIRRSFPVGLGLFLVGALGLSGLPPTQQERAAHAGVAHARREVAQRAYFIIPAYLNNLHYKLVMENHQDNYAWFNMYANGVPIMDRTVLAQEIINVPENTIPIDARLIIIEYYGSLTGKLVVPIRVFERTLEVPALSEGLKTEIFEFYKGPEAAGVIHIANINNNPIDVKVTVRDPHEVVVEEKSISLAPYQVVDLSVADFGPQAIEFGYDILLESEWNFIAIQTVYHGERPTEETLMDVRTGMVRWREERRRKEAETTGPSPLASIISLRAPWDIARYWVPFTYDGHQGTGPDGARRAVDFYYASTQSPNSCSGRNPEGGRGYPVLSADDGAATLGITRFNSCYYCISRQVELVVYGSDLSRITYYVHSEPNDPIRVGDAVFVSFNAGENSSSPTECPRITTLCGCRLQLRQSPGLSGTRIIGYMGPGQRLIVIDGPQYVDGLTWWKVKGYDLDQCLSPQPDGSCVGWAAEKCSSSAPRRALLSHKIHKGMQVRTLGPLNLRPCPKANDYECPPIPIPVGSIITLINDPSSPTQSESKAGSGYRYVWWKVAYVSPQGQRYEGWSVDAVDYYQPRMGVPVSKGNQIGIISDQGAAVSGPHIHFAVYIGGFLPLDDQDPNYIVTINNEVILLRGLNGACPISPGYTFTTMLRGLR
jgi:hypothetical protein